MTEKEKIKREKGHDCLSKVRDSIKKANPNIGWVRFSLSTIQDMNDPDRKDKTGQEIKYSYTHVTRGGEKVEKTATSFVAHEYCPFCGLKY